MERRLTKDIINKVKWFPIDESPELFWPEQTQLIRENRLKIEELMAGFSTMKRGE